MQDRQQMPLRKYSTMTPHHYPIPLMYPGMPPMPPQAMVQQPMMHMVAPPPPAPKRPDPPSAEELAREEEGRSDDPPKQVSKHVSKKKTMPEETNDSSTEEEDDREDYSSVKKQVTKMAQAIPKTSVAELTAPAAPPSSSATAVAAVLAKMPTAAAKKAAPKNPPAKKKTVVKKESGLDLLASIALPRNKNKQHPIPYSCPSAKKRMVIGGIDISSTSKNPRRLSELEEFAKKVYVDDVRDIDVLCGRGGKSNHHPGNKRYREVVCEMKRTYRSTGGRKAKTDLSRAIVEHVVGYGARFVKRDETGKHFLLTKAQARRKTSQALRETKELKWL